MKTWFSNARRSKKQKKKIQKGTINKQLIPKQKLELKPQAVSDIKGWKVYEVFIDNLNPETNDNINNKSKEETDECTNKKSDFELEVVHSSDMCIQNVSEMPVDKENKSQVIATCLVLDKAIQVEETDHINRHASNGKFQRNNTAGTNSGDKSNVSYNSVDKVLNVKVPKEILSNEKHQYSTDQSTKPESEGQQITTNVVEQESRVSKFENDNHLHLELNRKKCPAKESELLCVKRKNNKNVSTGPEFKRLTSVSKKENSQMKRQSMCTSYKTHTQCKTTCRSKKTQPFEITKAKSKVDGTCVKLKTTGITIRNITELDKELSTVDDVGTSNKNKNASEDSVKNIKSLLKQKLKAKQDEKDDKHSVQGNHNTGGMAGETLFSKSSDSYFDNFGSLTALSELCNRIDQDPFSHNSSNSSTFDMKMRAKQQKTNKSERLRKAWNESIRNYGDKDLSMEWYHPRSSSVCSAMYSFNQTDQNSSEQACSSSPYQKFRDVFTQDYRQLNHKHAACTQNKLLALHSPRIAGTFSLRIT